jgi:DDE superfamily endonuclease
VQPWLKEEWCLPPTASGEFVCAMEDVLDVYTHPYDPAYPQVCMDEMSKQLVGETRVPVPPAPGQVARFDYEYERRGVANLFLFFEPLAGWRHLAVTARRTKNDWAHAIRDLVDVHYPHARKIRLVLDNLNTHVGGSLYEAFPPAEARRLLDRLELHYTPKHGSWLNMAESELSILARQCFNRRIAEPRALAREVAAWEARRNSAQATMDWRFTTADARIKLTHLYPVITLPAADSPALSRQQAVA